MVKVILTMTKLLELQVVTITCISDTVPLVLCAGECKVVMLVKFYGSENVLIYSQTDRQMCEGG